MSNLDARLQELNQDKIDLGLDRLRLVYERLQIKRPKTIITVGGTNGKGSTVAALSALVSAQGLTCGSFTSPHIHRFNERISINGVDASDEAIIRAFALIDQHRRDTKLSYFEYAFLAAMIVFAEHQPDVVVLEVGLGGRLDATTVVDADAVIITTVDLDHMDWLGDDVEQIGAEKAGIMRPGRVAVLGDQEMPQSIQQTARQVGAELRRLNSDFEVTTTADGYWNYRSAELTYQQLPMPATPGQWQLNNFAAALTAVQAVGYRPTRSQLITALGQVRIKGRMQVIRSQPQVLADVAHNRQSAQVLAQWLTDHPVKGRTRAVFSVLADKQFDAWIGHFASVVDHWFIFELDSQRALDADQLKTGLAEHVSLISFWESADEAYRMALNASEPDDRVVVFGSFHVLDEVFSEQALNDAD